MAGVEDNDSATVGGGNADVVVVPDDDQSSKIDPDFDWEDHRSDRQRWVEFTLLCLANVGWTVDGAILPIFFHEFQVLFDVTQTQLSLLSTAKGWAAALFAFPCGFVGELLPRPQLIGMGMVFWACGLFLCSMATSFQMIFCGRVLNGIGLGIVQPLLLSLLVDKTAPTRRGSAIGSIFFTGQVCNTLFSLVATKYAADTILGTDGWRVAIACAATFSATVGILISFIVGEPNACQIAEKRKTHGPCQVFRENMPKVWALFKYPTFVLILCQGAPGTAPWTVFPFFTQWLELSCFTNGQAALIFSAFNWGNAMSNLLSGFLLNWTTKKFPDWGPPSLASFSVASGIPWLVLFFFILPKPDGQGLGGELVPLYFFCFLMFGLGAAMCGTINKKVFSDIVPANVYTYVFAIDQLIENAVGNLAGLSVGVITDRVFEYDASAVEEDGGCSRDQAVKLGKGMFAVCCVAWTICLSVYLGMFCTYPEDRKRQVKLRKEELKRKMALAKAKTSTDPEATAIHED